MFTAYDCFPVTKSFCSIQQYLDFVSCLVSLASPTCFIFIPSRQLNQKQMIFDDPPFIFEVAHKMVAAYNCKNNQVIQGELGTVKTIVRQFNLFTLIFIVRHNEVIISKKIDFFIFVVLLFFYNKFY